MAIIQKERYVPFQKLNTNALFFKTLTDSGKYQIINESYNAELNIITEKLSDDSNNSKLIYDTYFKHVDLLKRRLGPSYKLKANKEYINQKIELINKNALSNDCFRACAQYREAIYKDTEETISKRFSDYSNQNTEFSRAKFEYDNGKVLINNNLIRDWFLAKKLMSTFQSYKFGDVIALYDDYILVGTEKTYVDTLKKFFKIFIKLKPGSPAPAFKLKDITGNTVTLNDLRGKLVYIDFWGVSCAPCIAEIQEHSQNVHLKYGKKDVIFVNICLDATDKVWKNKVAFLKLRGINLIAEGGPKSAVYNDYNITGIPHYVLIDTHGNIINSNAPTLDDLASESRNIIDDALDLQP